MAVIVTNVVWTIGLALEAFRGDIFCSRKILLPNNSALPTVFITLTEVYEEKRRVTPTSGYLITVTMFQLLTSSLFYATAIFIPIQVQKIVIGIGELAVRGTTWRMQILGQMYLSFTSAQGVGD